MFKKYFIVNSLNDAVALSSRYLNSSKILAGGTDLILEMERGQHSDITEIIDISRIHNLDTIAIDDKEFIHIGPLVTHNACLMSTLIFEHARCLYQACASIGSPQIRNRGTIAGNIVTASPANDTISALMALDAQIEITSVHGKRVVAINKFFLGVRKTVLLPGELISDIYFKALKKTAKSIFMKVALRNAQAISIANVSVVLDIENKIIVDARIAMGAVAPTIIRAADAEKLLLGKNPSEEIFTKAGELASQTTEPISDIRSSEKYRRKMVAVQVKRALLLTESEKIDQMSTPVRLWGNETRANKPLTGNTVELDENTPIKVNINNKDYSFTNAFHKNLLDMIRENALLTGTKEGCGEGECGACTVYLDGITVLACLIPAARAHNASVVTIEGLKDGEKIHHVQQSFIEAGAVQCGYCTPGFIMSAVKLLEEKQNPTKEEIKIGISGNLCRCTGYYNIITAIEKAAER